jgi:hypothetical protein
MAHSLSGIHRDLTDAASYFPVDALFPSKPLIMTSMLFQTRPVRNGVRLPSRQL